MAPSVFNIFGPPINAENIELNERIKNNINNGIDDLLVKFRSFNNTVDKYLIKGFVYFLLVIVGALAFDFIRQIGQPISVISIPVGLLAFLISALLSLSLLSFLVAYFYIIFNFGVLIWISLQSIKNSFSLRDEGVQNKYIVKFPRYPIGYNSKRITVSEKNAHYLYYITIYGIFAFIFGVVGRLTPDIVMAGYNILAINNIPNELSGFTNLSVDFLRAIDFITPIDLTSLLTVQNISILSYILSIIFLFSSFRYFKSIQHDASKSSLEWSDGPEFTWKEKFIDIYHMIRISSLYYLEYDENSRVQKLFYELTKSGIIFSLFTFELFIFLYLFINI
ncbi:hypothetical protein [Halonotius terrestris]|uniref:hypothetical protein n=1 Tax=Halonotius terrestris TaxID=2487750 RepID=UPI00115D96C9|nr:hypothetical protein [Halonotius terrestris]